MVNFQVLPVDYVFGSYLLLTAFLDIEGQNYMSAVIFSVHQGRYSTVFLMQAGIQVKLIRFVSWKTAPLPRPCVTSCPYLATPVHSPATQAN